MNCSDSSMDDKDFIPPLFLFYIVPVQIPLWTIRTNAPRTSDGIGGSSDSSMDDKDPYWLPTLPHGQQRSDSSMDDKD